MPALKVICMQDTYWNHVTGCSKYHDSEAVDTVLSYCVQECKTPSSLIGGYGVNVKQASYEMQRLTDAYGKSNGLHLRHMVLSFSKYELTELGDDAIGEIYKIAKYTAQYYANEYQIVYAIHEDTGNCHVHFVMNTTSYVNGKKYRGDKADYYQFQAYLRQFLAEYYGLTLYILSDKRTIGNK